jgi:hypothetical protein
VFGRGAGAVLVWSGEARRRLLGFFPARIEKRRYGLTLPVLVGFTHSYGPLGLPLVEREAAEPVLAAFLAHVVAEKSLPGLLLLPFFPPDGPFGAVLDTVLRRARMPCADFNRHQRAMLAPNADRSTFAEQAIGPRQRKELRRQLRRLCETGAVLFTSATEPAAVERGLDDFLMLEAGGWKGRAGTAAAGQDDLLRFVVAAVDALAAEGKVAIDRILVDGRAIAATIVLRSGHGAWFWKIAYDEAFARFSPGVMLSAQLTHELADDATIARADSCATANHPMIDRLWRGRLALCSRLIAARPQAPFWLARRLEGLRVAGVAQAGSVRKHLLFRSRLRALARN